MERVSRSLKIIIGILWLGLVACGPNAGVEVGNPKVGGKSVTLHPEGSDATYIIEFLTDTSSQVTQIVENQFETVPAETTLEDDVFRVVADFSGGPHFDAQVTADAAGNILSVTLSLDGAPTPVEVVGPPPGSPAIKPLAENGAEQVVSGLCGRIVECHPEVSYDDCELAVAQQPGLAQELGGAPGQNLQGQADDLDHSGSEVDAEKLGQCLEAMTVLPCTQVDKGCDLESPDPYLQVRLLIPRPLCNQVFAPNH